MSKTQFWFIFLGIFPEHRSPHFSFCESGNGLGEEGGKSLASALENNQTLLSLDITGVYLFEFIILIEGMSCVCCFLRIAIEFDCVGHGRLGFASVIVCFMLPSNTAFVSFGRLSHWFRRCSRYPPSIDEELHACILDSTW